LFEKSGVLDQFDSPRRCGVIVLDGEQATWAQPASGDANHCGDHRHPVRATEHRVGRIMLGDFGFQRDAVGYIGRIGHYEVDSSVELGKQARCGDIGA
jgi:hypothetical protein